MTDLKKVFWGKVEQIVEDNTQVSFGSPFNKYYNQNRASISKSAAQQIVPTPVPLSPYPTMSPAEKQQYENQLVRAVDDAKEKMNNGGGTLMDLRYAEDALRVFRAIKGAGGNRNTVHTYDIKQAQHRADALGKLASFAKNEKPEKYWSAMKGKQNMELVRSALQRAYDRKPAPPPASDAWGNGTPDGGSYNSDATDATDRYAGYNNIKGPKERSPSSFWRARKLASAPASKVRVIKGKSEKQSKADVSGRKVIYTNGHSVVNFLNYSKLKSKNLTHALLIRNTVFVGPAHADAMAQAIRTFGGSSQKEKDEFAHLIDNDEEPIEYGYYYDNDFHLEPKDRSMVY